MGGGIGNSQLLHLINTAAEEIASELQRLGNEGVKSRAPFYKAHVKTMVIERDRQKGKAYSS